MHISLFSVKKTGQQVLVSVLFLLIPLLLFITSLQTIQSRNKAWYGGGYDPEYAYLFNALNMARFRLVGHIDHPGTTMQMAGGVVLEGAWLAEKRGENLTQAVLADPEYYIRILNVATAIIASLSLLVLAFIFYRRTRNVWYGLVIQLTPFVSGYLLFNGFTRVTQEVMLMVAAFAMATAALIWLFDPRQKKSRKYILLFGIISGFGMASKVLFAPLMIIPFILIEPFKSKIKFVFVSLGGFILFTLPIIRLYPNMLYWFYRLFIHSGQYGAGEKAVIDTSKYFGELLNLIKINPVLAIIVGMSMLVLIVFLIKCRLNNDRSFPPTAKLLLAVVLAQVAGYLLIAKQPKAAYLLPYESVVAVNLVVMLYGFVSLFVGKWLRTIISILGVVVFAILLIPDALSKKRSLYQTNKNPLWEQTWQAASSSLGQTAVIATNPGISPVPALYFGNAYSRSRYADELKQIYPNLYINDYYKGHVVDWSGNVVNFSELYKKYHGQIYHLGMKSQSPDFIDSMRNFAPEFQFQKVYENDRLEIISPRIKEDQQQLYLQKIIFCGGEVADSDANQVAFCNGFSYIGNPDMQNVFSGKASIKSEPGNPYAYTVEPFVAQAGDSVSISVWSSARRGAARIVMSSADPDGFYYTSLQDSIAGNTGWQLLQLNRKINRNEAGVPIKIYVWNKENDPAWFDNFRLEHYTSLKNNGE